jgi:folate-binding protein YgfZ
VKNWQDFTNTQDTSLQTSSFICSGDDLGMILVTGEDAADFLQNQLSNDIELIDETRYQMSSYSTPKGRMLAIFRVIQISNGYILFTPKSIVITTLQKLQLYVVNARVNLADASAHFARMIIQTDSSEIEGMETLPTQTGSVYQDDSIISLQLEPVNKQSRFLVCCLSFEQIRELWLSLAKTLKLGSFKSWQLSEINAAIPVIYPDTVEEFVLQMTNLNQLDGVSFKKGCYPGQEIVARMQYLGKLKRRMFLSRFKSDQCPLPGDNLVTEGKDIVDGSGKIVDAVMDDDGYCHCLYVAQIPKAESAQLRLLKTPDIKFSPADLPYSIDV